MLEHSSLTEKDLEDVDFDAFIKEQGITLETVERYDLSELLRSYKEKHNSHATPTASSRSEEMETAMLTKEYLIEHSSITEEDLEDVDFDAFVQKYELTPAMLEEYDVAAFLRMYKKRAAIPPALDYSYIYANADGHISAHEYESIKVLIWEYHEGARNYGMVVDKGNGSVFYDVGLSLSKVRDDERIGDWKEEDGAFLKNALEESGIASWKNEYIGTSENTTGHFAWGIAFELEDGRCFSYTGRGVLGSGTPESIVPLLETLKDHFVGK